MPAGENKSPSRGKGPWTAKGVQAAQQAQADRTEENVDRLALVVTKQGEALDAMADAFSELQAALAEIGDDLGDLPTP